MILKKIDIKNYRSIADLKIVPDPRCQVFVGINESGKTNILKALSLLSSERQISIEDLRNEGKDESKIEEAYVDFDFSLTEQESNEVIKKVLSSIHFENTPLHFIRNNKTMDLVPYLKGKCSVYYRCNIIEKEKSMNAFRNDDPKYVIQNLKKVKPGTNISIATKSGKTVTLTGAKLVAPSLYKEDALQYFEDEDCTTHDVISLLNNTITTQMIEKLPKVVFWEYDKSNLLPSEISLDAFQKNPNSCAPLQSMFLLAGYSDIEGAITDAQGRSKNVLKNLLDKVSTASTKYFKDVWKDYKGIEFNLCLNGANIDIFIKDEENDYECSQRSDGFKRFITFLLALSAKVKNNEINNSLIIIDEPDMGIHISGQKHLVKELINISDSNLVFYSTHSIFMIDKEHPNRHYIVTKKKEITNISQVNTSNYTDDEVINNALGYSIFETLKAKNFIFEGWTDKKVFKTAVNARAKKVPANLKQVGCIHSKGVKTITEIAKILELANRDYIIVSDSDQPSKDNKKKYEREECAGEWLFYEQLSPGVFTLEDFIKHDAFKKPIDTIRKTYPKLGAFNFTDFKKINYQREAHIKAWVKNYIGDETTAKSIISELKNELYSNITISQIEDEYYKMLSELEKKL
ncbi:ATP-binding protein [Christensenellaceae bacterium OttesenSCG-928-K19]|nr:ATP-binding protein [Christensenellaceae bacterium OttesenSCG-928-K19]